MYVTVTNELEQFVNFQLASGAYRSAEEVIAEALRTLRRKAEVAEKKAALIADIEQGLRSLEAGLVSEKTPMQILAEARENRKPSSHA